MIYRIFKNCSFVFAFLLLAGCGKNEARLTNASVMEFNMQATAASPTIQGSSTVERKLIKNGSLDFSTDDIDKTRVSITGICTTLHAYSSNESLRNLDDRIVYTQVIRVPAGGFEELILQVEKLADKVDSKSVDSRDVTEEYIDVETRLKTKKDLETRYRELLKIAKKVEEILSIERELAVVRGDIESMEGKLNYLKDQVAFSTLELTYYKRIGTDFGFASKFVDSLSNGWDNLLSFIIQLFNIWPFLLLIAALLWWLRRRWRSRKATKEQAV